MKNVTPIAVQSAKQKTQIKTANPLDLPAKTFQAGLARRRQNRAALMEWVRDALVEGTDYGRIHVMGRQKCPAGNRCTNPAHFSKPSLFKPGAEKICGMLGITIHYPSLSDYEKAALNGAKIHQIIIRCELRDPSGVVVADGVGARALAQDNGDLNKALKMSEKSAHIDATLRMAGLSEVFTQDLEDMRPPKPESETAVERITEAQRCRLEIRITELGLDRQRIKAWLKKASLGRVAHFNELIPDQYQTLDGKLDAWAERLAIQEETVSDESAAVGARR